MTPIEILNKQLEERREALNNVRNITEDLKTRIFENNLHCKTIENEIKELEKAIMKLS